VSRNSWNRIPYKKRQSIKQVLLARDGLICCVCGTRIASIRIATIEHKRGRKQGGSVTGYDNLGLAHPNCNFGHHGQRHGRVALVNGDGFFAPRTPDPPAPLVFPPPGRSEKNSESG
jgi:5-methylcytosine-specific restriction endonuclease McrA